MLFRGTNQNYLQISGVNLQKFEITYKNGIHIYKNKELTTENKSYLQNSAGGRRRGQGKTFVLKRPKNHQLQSISLLSPPKYIMPQATFSAQYKKADTLVVPARKYYISILPVFPCSLRF